MSAEVRAGLNRTDARGGVMGECSGRFPEESPRSSRSHLGVVTVDRLRVGPAGGEEDEARPSIDDSFARCIFARSRPSIDAQLAMLLNHGRRRRRPVDDSGIPQSRPRGDDGFRSRRSDQKERGRQSDLDDRSGDEFGE